MAYISAGSCGGFRLLCLIGKSESLKFLNLFSSSCISTRGVFG